MAAGLLCTQVPLLLQVLLSSVLLLLDVLSWRVAVAQS